LDDLCRKCAHLKLELFHAWRLLREIDACEYVDHRNDNLPKELDSWLHKNAKEFGNYE